MGRYLPNLNLPVIYVPAYGGYLAQMEGLLANYEYHFLYIGNVHHVESKNVQSTLGEALFPSWHGHGLAGRVVATVNRSRAFMPPPAPCRRSSCADTGSVPVGLCAVQRVQVHGRFRSFLQGAADVRGHLASGPAPFGASARSSHHPRRSRSPEPPQPSPDDVVGRVDSGTRLSVRAIRTEQMPIVPVNSIVVRPRTWHGFTPVGHKKSVMLEDLAPAISRVNR